MEYSHKRKSSIFEPVYALPLVFSVRILLAPQIAVIFLPRTVSAEAASMGKIHQELLIKEISTIDTTLQMTQPQQFIFQKN